MHSAHSAPQRRTRRSSVPSLALEFLLEAEQERAGARALSIGTLDGLPLAGVGDVDAASLAAAGAMRLAGMYEHTELGELASRCFCMSVVELPEGIKLLITSLDGVPLSTAVESGVVRILS